MFCWNFKTSQKTFYRCWCGDFPHKMCAWNIPSQCWVRFVWANSIHLGPIKCPNFFMADAEFDGWNLMLVCKRLHIFLLGKHLLFIPCLLGYSRWNRPCVAGKRSQLSNEIFHMFPQWNHLPIENRKFFDRRSQICYSSYSIWCYIWYLLVDNPS